MQQEIQYKVERLGRVSTEAFDEVDSALVGSYDLENEKFQVGYSVLSTNIYTQTEELLATVKDTRDFQVLGNNVGTKATQIVVDPVNSSVGLGFLGDVIVEYEAFNNLFGVGKKLFVSEISTDRTEIRAKSVDLTEIELRSKALTVYDQLNSRSYFSEIYLDFDKEDSRLVGTNIITEVIQGQQVVTFKLYKPLPDSVGVKDLFQVESRVGEPTRFLVQRYTRIIPDKIPQLRGPNFEVNLESSNTATDYLSSVDLLSYKQSGSLADSVKQFGKSGVHISINHENFEDFIHFSSAVERLENARYKFELLWNYQNELQNTNDSSTRVRYQKLIDGLISNFDHYENYLYFESGSTCWPKVSSKRPYTNVTHYLDIADQKGYKDWWNGMVEQADVYDLHNEDILIGTIPLTIREDPNNEPYVTFIHMIGQHFDDLWVYAKAISDKYKADNRLDFGISKDLVKHAIEDLGIDLYGTSQNLNSIFDQFRVQDFNKGEETSIESVKVMDRSGLYQPMKQDDYLKEVYKRIYHNVPVLLKTKGTERCIRVLLNCFGIPESILNVKVFGGIDSELRPYFDPGERNLQTIDKIRLDNDDRPVQEYVAGQNGLNSFKANDVLSRYVEVDKKSERYSDDEHRVEIGFNVNEASSKFFRDKLKDRLDLNLEDSFGDPRNTEDQYGDPYKHLREILLKDLGVDKRFQSPAAIIRLARYFDLTFFRIVKDFLPARSVLTTGVVVEDNKLHRNRYKGVKVSWKNETLSVTLPIGSVEGTSGGSLESEVRPEVTGSWIYGTSFRPIVRSCEGDSCKKTWTVNHVTQSRTGTAVFEKSVFDDSPKYNGILSGSNLTVTDGWLTSQNPHHKSLQLLENYGVCLYFLDLPEPPLCNIQTIVQKYLANIYLIKSRFNVDFYEISKDQSNVFVRSGSAYGALLNLNDSTGKFVAESSSFSTPAGTDARGYMGWYERRDREYDSRDREFLTPRPELTEVGTETWWKLGPKYRDVQEDKFRLEVQLDYLNEFEYYKDTHYGSYSYKPGDFILSWRFVGQNNYPPHWTEAVWTEIGDIVYRIKPKGYDVVEGVLPTKDLYGTNRGYSYIVLNLGVEGIDSIESFGIKSAAGGYRGPWKGSRGFIDADWFDCYDIWGTGSLARQDRWTVVSSSRV